MEAMDFPCQRIARNKPAIAQLVEHLTVELAAIRWSLVRFRVAGLFLHKCTRCPSAQGHSGMTIHPARIELATFSVLG